MKKYWLLLLLGVLVLYAFADSPHTPRAPIVVAAPSFLNQTVDLPDTTVFTPTSVGLYRVSVYAEFVPQPPTNPCTSFQIDWTDDQNIRHGQPVNLCSDHGGGDVTIYSIASVPISIFTQSNAINGNSFNVFVAVEQL